MVKRCILFLLQLHEDLNFYSIQLDLKQVREHREENARAKEEEKNWADQEVAINRLRGMLEDENHAR